MVRNHYNAHPLSMDARSDRATSSGCADRKRTHRFIGDVRFSFCSAAVSYLYHRTALPLRGGGVKPLRTLLACKPAAGRAAGQTRSKARRAPQKAAFQRRRRGRALLCFCLCAKCRDKAPNAAHAARKCALLSRQSKEGGKRQARTLRRVADRRQARPAAARRQARSARAYRERGARAL